jgi:DNA-binding NarL/FixJ family response regulator
MVKIKIVSDNIIIRRALEDALDGLEAPDGNGSIKVQQTDYDVAVIDVARGFIGLELFRADPSAKPCVAIGYDMQPGFAARALLLGARSYIGAANAWPDLLRAIQFASRDEASFTGWDRDAIEVSMQGGGPAGHLTPREQQVMRGLARGLTNHEIADHLEINVKTVDTHRGHVMHKLSLRNNSELTRFASRFGYVPPT